MSSSYNTDIVPDSSFESSLVLAMMVLSSISVIMVVIFIIAYISGYMSLQRRLSDASTVIESPYTPNYRITIERAISVEV